MCVYPPRGAAEEYCVREDCRRRPRIRAGCVFDEKSDSSGAIQSVRSVHVRLQITASRSAEGSPIRCCTICFKSALLSHVHCFEGKGQNSTLDFAAKINSARSLNDISYGHRSASAEARRLEHSPFWGLFATHHLRCKSRPVEQLYDRGEVIKIFGSFGPACCTQVRIICGLMVVGAFTSRFQYLRRLADSLAAIYNP